MKRDLLLISDATPRMMEQFSKNFTVHRMDALDAKASSIEAVATDGHLGVKPEILDKLPNLKVISCYGVGYDAIDVQACAKRGIPVAHTPGVLSANVANTAIMLMLSCTHKYREQEDYVRDGRWEKEGNFPLTRSLDGKKVGILGLGRIGETLAQKLQAFDCPIVYHSRNKKSGVPYEYHSDLTEMAAVVDYLVVITPGGPSTSKLVNQSVIDALGPEGTLINVSRGSVIDEEAMIASLKDGRLGAAGLDVFATEPSVPESLRSLPNVAMTPHIGSATVETRQAMGDLVAGNLDAFFDNGKVKTSVPETDHL
ncbi:2-hydroxyacid dehydrogenase [Alphaproteobacteria bacterium]|jgi:lactate dehydrogenase-like 2-hydroxyacid dehydrogenase|nr:2-hydroxyacid dehydrogenase [Alphaproteobacteria bacterium]